MFNYYRIVENMVEELIKGGNRSCIIDDTLKRKKGKFIEGFNAGINNNQT